ALAGPRGVGRGIGPLRRSGVPVIGRSSLVVRVLREQCRWRWGHGRTGRSRPRPEPRADPGPGAQARGPGRVLAEREPCDPYPVPTEVPVTGVLELVAAHPVLLLFAVVGLGSAIGHLQLRWVGLGAAAVLFLALLVGAVGASEGVEVTVPPAIGTLGLTLFTFTVGIVSGPEFFASLRRSLGLVGVTVGVL